MSRTDKKPSSLDVAQRARVSRTTVSYVLNGRVDLPISSATRERVFLAASELGYRHNHLARSLRSGNSMFLGVVQPGLDEPYLAEIVHGVEEVCAERGYRVLIANSQRAPEIEARQVELLLEHRIDGLICVPSEHTLLDMPVWLDSVQSNGTACVIVDDRTYAHRADCVASDDYRGAQLAVEHLVGLGYRRVAHLSGSPHVSSGRDRQSGYMSTLSAAGLRVDSDLICMSSFEPAGVPQAIADLLALGDRPEAIFADNDVMAAEALLALTKHGLRVPEDIALVGYGNMAWGRYLNLTTVDQDNQAMGREAASRLLSRLESPQLPPGQTILPTHLVVRKTCGAQAS